jgi:hypothetical protein
MHRRGEDWASGSCGRIVRSFFFFSFCYKGSGGKTVQYNDNRDANKGATGVYVCVSVYFHLSKLFSVMDYGFCLAA